MSTRKQKEFPLPAPDMTVSGAKSPLSFRFAIESVSVFRQVSGRYVPRNAGLMELELRFKRLATDDEQLAQAYLYGTSYRPV